ncbi:MAG TPA: molybdenum cofactor biosynthesis protein MoaE [Gemmatimonadales bacterium]|nr:molybdenum cofactor biosynthesis protein MoaE [Gemmatimonadales bacterium]
MADRYLTTSPLSHDTLLRAVESPAHGAVVSFVGTVRDHHEGRSVVGLSYSAYVEMAERECQAIVEATEGRLGVRIALNHRIGDLAVGDAAVVVVAAAPHRDVAFEACRLVIDEVKRRVPIWKHEHHADGTAIWVDPAGGSPA